jgi:hypothetical protein
MLLQSAGEDFFALSPSSGVAPGGYQNVTVDGEPQGRQR